MARDTGGLLCRVIPKLLLGFMVSVLSLLPWVPADAEHISTHPPTARLQLVLKKFHVFDDNDWIGKGEISMHVQVLACKSYEPQGMVPCEYDRRVASTLLTFSADSGDHVPFNTIVAKVKRGLDALNESDGDDDTFPVYAGERYVVSVIAIERDGPLLMYQLYMDPWTYTGYLMPDGLDLMGAASFKFDEGNNFGIGAQSALGKKKYGGDFAVDFELRHLPLPDVVPHNGRYQRLDDGRGLICAGALNRGEIPAGPFSIGVRLTGPGIVNGTLDLGTFDIPSLDVSQVFDHCFLIQSGGQSHVLGPGQYRAEITVDPDKKLVELTDSNNFRREQFTIATAASQKPAAAGAQASGGPASSSTGPTTARPDLVVTAIRVQGEKANNSNDCDPGKNDVIATIKNAGDASAAGFSIRLRIDNDEVAEKSLTGLEANKESEVRFDDARMKKGQQEVSVLVDARKTVAESEEGNNEKEVTVTCKDE